MKKVIYPTIATLVLMSGCAKKAEDIQAAYISPLQYQNYSCQQLQMEMERVRAKVAEVAEAQDKQHTKDVVATTVGLVVFWPALFMLAGSDKAQELSHLKGEYDALQRAAIAKDCEFAQTKETNATLHSSL